MLITISTWHSGLDKSLIESHFLGVMDRDPLEWDVNEAYEIPEWLVADTVLYCSTAHHELFPLR